MLDKLHNINKTAAKGQSSYSSLYVDMFLKRLGSVQNYSDRGDVYIEEGYQNNPTVFSIVKVSAALASSAKFVCKDHNGDVVDVPGLSTLMYRPQPDKSWADYIQDTITQKMLTGNAFSAISKFKSSSSGLRGKPRELFIMPSNEIQLYLSDGNKKIEQYILDFHGGGHDPEMGVSAKDVLHLRNPNPDYSIEGDFLWGQAPSRAARRSIQVYNDTLESGVWYIQNKGVESILVNADPEAGDLDDTVVDQLKSKLRLQSQGPKNAGNVPIIDANLKAISIGSTPEDIKLLPLRIQAAKEICNVFSFPAQLLGIDDATYQNAKEAKKALWEMVIIPELEEIKGGLNRWLAPMYGPGFYIDYDLNHIDALQEDRLMRGKAISEYGGLITYNQALTMAGLPTYDWMKAPTNMEELKKQLYVGFTQAVISDDDDLKNSGGEPKEKTDDKS